MKRRVIYTCAALLALCTFITGCSNGSDDDDEVDVTLKSIEVAGNLQTTTYSKGDTFSAAGLAITALYSDDSKTAVNTSVAAYSFDDGTTTFKEGDALTDVGAKTLTISYSGKKAATTYPITVYKFSVTGADTLTLSLGELAADWAKDIKVMVDGEDKTSDAAIKLFIAANNTEVSVGTLIDTDTEYAFSVTYAADEAGGGTMYYNAKVEKIAVDAGWRGSIGSTGWWQSFATEENIKLDSGKVLTTTMVVDKIGTENWQCVPTTLLCNTATRGADANAAYVEYGVLRADAYGWRGADNTADALETLGWKVTHDWGDFSTFKTFALGATVTITATNWGNNTADVVYTFEKGTETHVVSFKNITVDSATLYFNITPENCVVTFLPDEITAIAITTQPTKTEYSFIVEDTSIEWAADLTGMVVKATYSDETTGIFYNGGLTVTKIKSQAGTQDLSVAYGNYTADDTVTVTVTEAKVVDKGYSTVIAQTGNDWAASNVVSPLDIDANSGVSISYQFIGTFKWGGDGANKDKDRNCDAIIIMDATDGTNFVQAYNGTFGATSLGEWAIKWCGEASTVTAGYDWSKLAAGNYITMSYNEDGSTVCYINGVKAFVYNSNLAIGTSTIGAATRIILDGFKGVGNAKVNLAPCGKNTFSMSNVVLTRAVNDAEAAVIYETYGKRTQ